MLGTVVNALAIVAGGLVGLCCTRGIGDRFRQTVLQGWPCACSSSARKARSRPTTSWW